MSFPDKKKPIEISHSELAELGELWLRCHDSIPKAPTCNTVAKEVKSSGNEQPDIIGWSEDNSILIEVKVNKRDFKQDSKKKFRYIPHLGVGELRYYLCPAEMIQPDELPINWGLLWFTPSYSCLEIGSIVIKKKAKKQEANIKAERNILVSLLNKWNSGYENI